MVDIYEPRGHLARPAEMNPAELVQAFEDVCKNLLAPEAVEPLGCSAVDGYK